MPGSPEARGPATLSTAMLFAAMNCRSAAACAGSSPSSFASTKCGLAKRMAKAEAEEAFAFAADRAIQFHGGYGFTYDCDAQLYRRRAIWNAALYGDARYHRRKLADLMF